MGWTNRIKLPGLNLAFQTLVLNFTYNIILIQKHKIYYISSLEHDTISTHFFYSSSNRPNHDMMMVKFCFLDIKTHLYLQFNISY